MFSGFPEAASLDEAAVYGGVFSSTLLPVLFLLHVLLQHLHICTKIPIMVNFWCFARRITCCKIPQYNLDALHITHDQSKIYACYTSPTAADTVFYTRCFTEFQIESSVRQCVPYLQKLFFLHIFCKCRKIQHRKCIRINCRHSLLFSIGSKSCM